MKKPYFQASDFEPCHSPGYLMRRVYQQMVRHADHIMIHGDLTFTQWIVLVQLRDGSATTGADICRNLNRDSGATTRLIDQLEERGLLERHRSAEDRRICNLAITAEGRAMAKKLTPRVVEFWNELFADFSHAEVDTLMSLLGRLLTRLEDVPLGSVGEKPAADKQKRV